MYESVIGTAEARTMTAAAASEPNGASRARKSAAVAASVSNTGTNRQSHTRSKPIVTSYRPHSRFGSGGDPRYNPRNKNPPPTNPPRPKQTPNPQLGGAAAAVETKSTRRPL